MARGLCATVLAVVLFTLSACTVTTGGNPLPKRPVPDPVAAELQISDGPAWTSSALQVHPIEAAWLVGDAVVIVSAGAARVTVVDLTTGAELWRIDYGGALPGDPTGQGATFRTGSVLAGAGVVVVPYFATSCQQDICHESDVPVGDETGYAALAIDTGQVVWKSATVPGVPPDSPDEEYLSTLYDESAVVSDSLLVANVSVLNGLAPPSGKPWRYSVGVDLATGTTLWQADGFTTHSVSDATAYGVTIEGSGEASVSVPAGIDTASGAMSWELPAPDKQLLYAGTGTDAALLAGEGAGPKLELVTAAGEPLDSPGTNLMWNCPKIASPGRLACVIDDFTNPPRILTISDDGPFSSEAPVPDSSTVSYVDETYIYLSTTAEDGRRTSYATDAHGNHLSRDIPGEVVATSEKYVAIFDYPPDDSYVTVAVYTRS